MKLFLGGLGPSPLKKEIMDFLEPFGKLRDVYVPRFGDAGFGTCSSSFPFPL